jgi:hypothetical protein
MRVCALVPPSALQPTGEGGRVALRPAKPAKEGRCENPASANFQVFDVVGVDDEPAERRGGPRSWRRAGRRRFRRRDTSRAQCRAPDRPATPAPRSSARPKAGRCGRTWPRRPSRRHAQASQTQRRTQVADGGLQSRRRGDRCRALRQAFAADLAALRAPRRSWEIGRSAE